MALAIANDGQIAGIFTLLGAGASRSISGTVTPTGTFSATTILNAQTVVIAGPVSLPGNGHLIGTLTVTPSGSTVSEGTLTIDLVPLP